MGGGPGTCNAHPYIHNLFMLHAFTYIHIPGFWNKRYCMFLTQMSYTIQNSKPDWNNQHHKSKHPIPFIHTHRDVCFIIIWDSIQINRWSIPLGTWTMGSTPEAWAYGLLQIQHEKLFQATGGIGWKSRKPTTRFWCPNIWFSSRSLSVPDFWMFWEGRGFWYPDLKKVGSLIFEVDLSGWSNSFQIQFLVEILEIPAVLSRRWADGPTSDCKTSSSRWDSKLPRRSYTLQGTSIYLYIHISNSTPGEIENYLQKCLGDRGYERFRRRDN